MHPAFSLLFFLPLASAMSGLTISSTNPTSGGTVTITWTYDATSDPATCDLVLVNANFHNTFAIANNVHTADGTTTLALPIVPADSYQVEAVQINNINSAIDTSGAITIGATVTTSSSASTSGSSISSSSGSVSTPASSASTTGSASSLSATTSTSTSSSSDSASSPSASSFNGKNGAVGSHIDGGKVGSIAMAVVGIVAGAVF